MFVFFSGMATLVALYQTVPINANILLHYCTYTWARHAPSYRYSCSSVFDWSNFYGNYRKIYTSSTCARTEYMLEHFYMLSSVLHAVLSINLWTNQSISRSKSTLLTSFSFLLFRLVFLSYATTITTIIESIIRLRVTCSSTSSSCNAQSSINQSINQSYAHHQLACWNLLKLIVQLVTRLMLILLLYMLLPNTYCICVCVCLCVCVRVCVCVYI